MSLVPTGASPGPGVSGTNLGSIRTWLHCFLTGTHLHLLTLVFTWATPGHGDTGSHLGLTWTWLLSFHHGPHVDLVAAVFLAFHVPGNSCLIQGLTRTW